MYARYAPEASMASVSSAELSQLVLMICGVSEIELFVTWSVSRTFFVVISIFRKFKLQPGM